MKRGLFEELLLEVAAALDYKIRQETVEAMVRSFKEKRCEYLLLEKAIWCCYETFDRTGYHRFPSFVEIMGHYDKIRNERANRHLNEAMWDNEGDPAPENYFQNIRKILA